MSFQLSPELNGNVSSVKIFTKSFSELSDRYDAQFYWANLNFENCIKLSEVARVSGGKRLPKGFDYSSSVTNYRYLRVGDINWDSTLNYSGFKYIAEDLFRLLKSYAISNGDLMIAIVGATIGKCSLLRNTSEEEVVLTENCAKIRLKSDEVIPEYLLLLLQSDFVQKQIQLNYIQTTLPKLGLDRVLSLRIPEPPSLNLQQYYLDIYQEAFNAKKQKEAEAQQLLESIDDYLLDALGIELPEQEENTIQNRIFTRRLSEVTGGRFDPFFSSLNKQDRSGKYKFYKLKKLARIKKGNSITSDDVVDGAIPVIAGGQTSPYNHNMANSNGDVITVSASGAYSGYVWYHESSIFASDCTMISSKNTDKLSNKYIFEYLKTEQQDIYNLQQGSGQPHVYPSDLEKIKIPVPPPGKQVEIVNHIAEIRNEAEALQQKANAELKQAKKEVETIILGANEKKA